MARRCQVGDQLWRTANPGMTGFKAQMIRVHEIACLERGLKVGPKGVKRGYLGSKMTLLGPLLGPSRDPPGVPRPLRGHICLPETLHMEGGGRTLYGHPSDTIWRGPIWGYPWI